MGTIERPALTDTPTKMEWRVEQLRSHGWFLIILTSNVTLNSL